MKRFFRYLSLASTIFFCTISIQTARADVFSPVPTDSPLYTQLQVVQTARWEADLSGREPHHKKTGNEELTRYEFAIEVAKSAIDFNAHRHADAGWLSTVPRPELRALRALVLEFEVELVDFKVNTKELTHSIDEVLRSPASTNASSQGASLKLQSSQSATPSGIGEFPSVSALRFNENENSDPVVNLSLSQKLRLYGSVSSSLLQLPQQNYVASAEQKVENSSVAARQNSVVSAGANMDVNDWLSLRADYAFNRRNQPLTLQQTLTSNNSWLPSVGESRSFGGGVDVKVAPSLTLSGGISRLSLNSLGQVSDFSGTQLEGGVGVSGWSNRLLLSASLAHLMPDDPMSLDSTAARLNLDLALSNSLSLNLLYQQMFSLSPQNEGKSTFAGGVNIHF